MSQQKQLPSQKRFLNIYPSDGPTIWFPSGTWSLHASRVEADLAAPPETQRSACIEIDWPDGKEEVT